MIPLQTHALSVQLGNRSLLQRVSLSIAAGELVVLLGPNGCGKSTLLKAICGEIPAQGAVQLFERSRREWPVRQLARQLAVLPQHSDLRFDFTAQQVVAMGRLPWAEPQPMLTSAVERAMLAMDIGHLRDAPYLQLSGGERQRAHLARVYCQLDDRLPGLLLLDEPTSALDPGHQHQVLQQICALTRRGHAVLMVLHDLNLASRYADRLILMQQGQILDDGDVEHVLNADHLHTLYGDGPELWHHPRSKRPVVV